MNCGKKLTIYCRHGTKYIWVVRLTGPRRVEVHEPGQPMRRVMPGEMLTAPGVLRNPVKVEALYNREAAHEATLRNLLQRQGYDSIEAIEAKGKAKGEAKGKAEGKTEEAATLLKRQINRRFKQATHNGPRRVLIKPTTSQLEAWAEAIFDAEDIEQLLRPANQL